MKKISVQAEDFDAGAELAALNLPGTGGIGSFIGTVRGDGDLVALELEHYPAMTAPALEKIVDKAWERWELLGCTVIHRFGRLLPAQQIVFIGAASAHRADALAATAFLIDWLKTSAPFWKREVFASGEARWVEARLADDDAASAWTK